MRNRLVKQNVCKNYKNYNGDGKIRNQVTNTVFKILMEEALTFLKKIKKLFLKIGFLKS